MDKIKKYRFCNEEERDFLKTIIPGRSHAEIIKMFSEKFNKPLNRNTLMKFIYENQIYTERTNQFQKGHLNSNYKEIGSTRINKHGCFEVKVAAGTHGWKWELLHKIIWEAENGPIPEGHILTFADGNKQNINIENLLLVTKTEIAKMNAHSLRSNDADLTKAGLLVAKLLLKIKERRSEIK